MSSAALYKQSLYRAVSILVHLGLWGLPTFEVQPVVRMHNSEMRKQFRGI